MHDPLVEWSKAVKSGAGTRAGTPAKAAGRDETAEQERGKEALEKIRSRLEASSSASGQRPRCRSPQGQARRLIEGRRAESRRHVHLVDGVVLSRGSDDMGLYRGIISSGGHLGGGSGGGEVGRGIARGRIGTSRRDGARRKPPEE